MKSVANIQKITKAMKMVAASKMRSAQVATENSRGMQAPMLKLLGDLPNAEVSGTARAGPWRQRPGLSGRRRRREQW